MMEHGERREEVTVMERDEEKMKDNNTYTGDGDDLDLVTLEKTSEERGEKKEKEIERDRVEEKKNLCREEIDNINILINKRNGSERGRGTEEKGTYIVHTVIESENNSLENKQSCHSNKYGWPEIQQQYAAGRDCGAGPAPKNQPITRLFMARFARFTPN